MKHHAWPESGILSLTGMLTEIVSDIRQETINIPKNITEMIRLSDVLSHFYASN
jgi:hypothetical protein